MGGSEDLLVGVDLDVAMAGVALGGSARIAWCSTRFGLIQCVMSAANTIVRCASIGSRMWYSAHLPTDTHVVRIE